MLRHLLGHGSLFQAPRETREGENEGTKTRGALFLFPSPPRFRPLALSFARLSRSLEQARLRLLPIVDGVVIGLTLYCLG